MHNFNIPVTDEEKELSRAWWRSLSINEMKAFVKKYFPAFETNWNLVGQMSGFLFSIYEQEGVK